MSKGTTMRFRGKEAQAVFDHLTRKIVKPTALAADPVDRIRDICDDAQGDKLTRISGVLGGDAAICRCRLGGTVAVNACAVHGGPAPRTPGHCWCLHGSPHPACPTHASAPTVSEKL